MCILKFPQVIVVFPPQAATNEAVGASLCNPESVTNQPLVAST